MHLPVDKDMLARVVSSKLTGNYTYQEDCGSSDTTSYFKLVKRDDIHHKVLVGVNTAIPMDNFEKSLLERKFDQNIAFLGQVNARSPHPLCPVVLANEKPSPEFAYSWVTYQHVEGWPLASTWHQLKPEIRITVVKNIATFVRELALIRHVYTPNEIVSVDYVDSANDEHILFPPVLAANSTYWKNDRELQGVTNYADLISLLAEGRAAVYDDHVADAGTKSLAAERLRAIIPVASTILAQQNSTVLAHMNLLPQNIWIDPFTGKVTAIFGWEYAHYAPTWMATAPLGWLMDEKKDWMLESEKMVDPWAVWRPHFEHPPENTAKEMKELRRTWEKTLRLKEEYGPLDSSTTERDNLMRTAMKICFAEEEQLPVVVNWCRDVVSPSASVWTRGPWMNVLFMLPIAVAVAWLFDHYSTQYPDGTPILLLQIVIAGTIVQFSWDHGCSTRTSLGSSNGDESAAFVKFQRGVADKTLKGLDGVARKRGGVSIFGYGRPVNEKGGEKKLAAVPCSPANSIMPSGIYIPNFLSRAATMMSRAPTAAFE